jgi:glycosyltransferase involved in cell wall biosynthesis
MRTSFFTICATNYIALARVLMRGIARHHPDAARHVILLDEPQVDLSHDNFELILARELTLPDFESFTFRYDISELSTAIKPYAFLELFRRGFEACIFLDPDIAVYAPLDDALDALSGVGQAALTPHRLTPGIRTGWPDDRDLLQVGAYNLGFLTARQTPQVVAMLEWWGKRLERECLVALDRGLFVDQKWVDLWPSFCPHTTILRHPGYNVAYWNLGERKVERSDRGHLANGEPLVFFHFSGVVPRDARIFSKHQDFFTPANIGDADQLLQSYRREVLDSGHAELEGIACRYSCFENGVAIPSFARALFRRNETLFPDPYRTVFQTLQKPSGEIAPNPGGVVSVAAHELWQLRKDLQHVFPMDSLQSQLDFSEWFARHGCAEEHLDPEFAKPVAERLEKIAPSGPRTRSWPSFSSIVRRALALYRRSSSLQRMWQSMPVRLRGTSRKLILRLAYRAASPSPPTPTGALPHGVDDLQPGALLVGYPKAEMGVGQALRGLAQACREAPIPFGVFDFGLNLPLRQQDDTLTGDITWSASFACNILCVNADQWPVAHATLGKEFFARRYNILRPFWELARLPSPWAFTLSGLQEIWAPTRFVAKAFASAVSCPVELIPVPVVVKLDNRLQRASFGLPKRRFLFLFFFDFASFITRKNPEGVIKAFKHAFPNGTDDVGLVIKVHGGAAGGDRRTWLAEQAADPRISIIDQTLPREQVGTLMKLSDCFVSLHRSEGFGLGMAEAMALGKPVIGTDYSGNTDFLTEETGFPVAYRLVPVAPGAYPGSEDQVWAEPDIEHASWLMRRIVAGDDNVVERIEAGRRYMAEHHSPAAVGLKCRERLAQLGLVPPTRQ